MSKAPQEDPVPTPPPPTVTVLGGGSWGTSLAHLAATASGRALLWCRRPDQITEINQRHTNERYLKDATLHPGLEAVDDLRLAVSGADLIIVAVPSQHLRQVIRDASEHLQGDQMLVSATKGFEVDTFTSMTAVVRQETCLRKLGVLSGPNLAAEVMVGQPTASVVASRYQDVFTTTARALMGKRFRVYGSDDPVGVEVAGALKNIYAICAGFVDGAGLGANTRAALITRGLAEMTRIGTRLGAQPLTLLGLAGVGDLVVTCTSSLSRNYSVGFHLAKGEKLSDILTSRVSVAEGVRTTEAVTRHARRLGVKMPIAEGVNQVLGGRTRPLAVLVKLMARKARYEIEPADLAPPDSHSDDPLGGMPQPPAWS